MHTLIKDVRYSIRSLIRQRGFTAVAVITLSLGIGANVAIFSLINALILKPPRIAESDRVVAVWRTPIARRNEGFVSYLNLQDWRTRNTTFEDIAGHKSQGFIMTNQGEAERIQGMRVTANFFPLLRISPMRGRNFLAEEEREGAAPVAIISYELWQNRFGGNEGIINQPISINGKSHTIIGILPPQFEFPFADKNSAIWTTVAGEGSNLPERGAQVLHALGRLKPGVTIEQAQTDMARVAAGLAQEYPKSDRDTTVYLVGAHEQLVGREIRRALWLLLGGVGFVLLIACTNMANLMLLRASNRQKEVAIRAALGAGRWRIAQHLITESLLLSLFSGAVGVLLAVWGLSAIKSYAAGQLPRLDEVTVDARVLAFTLAVSVITGLLFSLLPTLKTSHLALNEVLKSGTKSATSSHSVRIWRDSLVVAEVALSLTLLIGAGLMIRSFQSLVNVSPGFDPNNVLTARISFTNPIYEATETRVAYVNQTLERLKAIPGVESAALIAPMPFSGGNVGADFRIEGTPVPEPGREPTANNRSVTAEYFQAMKIPLLQGRYFTDQDQRGKVGVAIVNQTFVRRYFPNEEPLGKRLSHIGANQNDGDPEQWEIVGVVGDVHHTTLIKPATAEIYLPYQQNSWTWGNFLVRTKSDPAPLTAAFRDQIRAGDKSVPITEVRPLSAAISETVGAPRFYTLLFAFFGGLGLVLTMTGVYGVIAYTVAQRTQEIGIRLALGASRPNVMKLVLRHGVLLAVAGSAIGLGVSIVLSRLVVSLLFEVKPTDLISFGVATAVSLGAAILASYVPAWRATKVDPLVALRYE